ncbi:hypothetical protein [Candidatus Binatus sp.]|uniref:hypothetical protein n=1 Tax=Candidatus Binatus sp. TaxID=2811406 RepID=UPI003CC50CFA
MRPFDAAELYAYGVIRAFQYLRAGVPFSQYGDLITDVMADLDHFARRHKFKIANQAENPDELRNAIAAAEVLHNFVSGTLYPLRGDLLKEKHIELLRDCLSRFETALKLDLGALPIYVLEDKRGYSAWQFLTRWGARTIFSKNEQAQLPRLCLEDIDHAGRSLMHDQFTAAGFHMIRALESVARTYYERVKGGSPVNSKGEFLQLGVMASALKDVLTQLADQQEGLLGEIVPPLIRITKIYRNPIMHPEMVLQEDNAIRVFENAKLAISEMLEDITAPRSYFAK